MSQSETESHFLFQTVNLEANYGLDVLYAIHQLTITFITYIFKITSLTLNVPIFQARAQKKFFVLKKTGHIT